MAAPRTITIRPAFALVLVPVLLAGTVLSGCHGGGGGAGGTGRSANPSAVGGRYLLALGSADVAMADPGRAGASARDALTVVSLPIREPSTPVAQVDVPNSPAASPAAVAVSPDGRFAYVVDTGRPGEAGGHSGGDSVVTVDLSNLGSPREAGTTVVGPRPMAVAAHPSGRFLAVATANPRAQLAIAPVEKGVPGTPITWPLLGLDDDEAPATSVAWHPSGGALAVSLAQRGEVVFYKFKEMGADLAIAPWGAPVRVGPGPNAGQFTRDGRYFVSLDAGGHAEGQPAGPGRLSVVRVSDNFANDDTGADHRVVGAADTGIAPVGMALSPDNRLVACVNTAPAGAGGGRGGSVALYELSRDGGLRSLGEFVLEAVPAGVTFDTSGRFVCISQFASLDPNAADGEVSFWRVQRGGKGPALEQQDFFLGIGGGPHGALIVR